MQDYVVELTSEPSHSFRAQKAANSLDINIKEKLKHRLEIKNVDINDNFSIGMIIGASGSGKTTLAKQILNFKDPEIDKSKTLIDLLPEKWTYDQCAELLSGCGLNSVPCWIKPFYCLSNGQQARGMAALEFASKNENEICVIDEWTSVVDRNAAKSMSYGISKYCSKNKRKLVLICCHYDIIEWIQPDWIIDCNEQIFYKPGKKKEKINLNLKSKDCQTEERGSIFQNIII